MINPKFIDSRPDIYGTDAYNQAFGLTPLTYGAGNPMEGTAKHNTIGLLTGNTLRPGLSMFNSGIDPQKIIADAGLGTAQGQYVNGQWQASGQDSYAARDKRIAALKAAGLSDSDARVEADRGYAIPTTEEEMYQSGQMQRPQQQMQQQKPVLQPFQMTSQYQGYMNGNAQSPGTNSFAQLLPFLNQSVNFGQQPQTQQNPLAQQAQMPQQNQFVQSYTPNAGLIGQTQQQQPQQRGLLSGGQFGSGNRYGLLSALG